jgi:hypothetical protein
MPVIIPTNPPTEVPSASLTAAPVMTATPAITATSTITLTPVNTSTPTKTSIPKPAALTGNISLSAASEKPLVTSIELRQGDSFKLIESGKTNASGIYKLSNIQPGKYELWVLFSVKAAITPGCSDVVLPSSDWSLGIMFTGDKALTMKGNSLQMLVFFMKNLNDPSLQATGLYAVIPDLEIDSGAEKEVDLTFLCK